MEVYQYNQYIGSETIDKEYKLFTLHFTGINIDPNNISKCEKIIEDRTWILNKSVMENLYFYIEYYLPKYASAFLNPSYSKPSAEMYFGISDDGFVHGIPYKGELDIEKINEKFNSVLKSDLIKYDQDVCSNLNKYIDLEIVKVDVSKFKFNDNHLKFLEEYFFQKKEYDKKMDDYKRRKKVWNNLMTFYCDKLCNLLNYPNTRYLILKFVEESGEDYNNIIELLKSDKIFDSIDGEEVHDLKKDKETIWYWVTEWRDFITDHIKEFRPICPPYTHRIHPANIILTLVDMIPLWLEKNNINLYLIKFNFKKPEIDINIKYKLDSDYICCYRSLDSSDEPISYNF